ncbi:hypothetical protein BUALT_Bualt02G0221800 [Buddleja alternifolia]|uniref:Peptidase A1 domain-containing protein n=1 Tax=Buddleja alternifolia TaxID=168488 RepID=A0AAV6Y2D4_9LAMI|nr:hypothetical protein BUALT_Bualt02G0221800 [Buddleja alternifolia]
MSSLPHQVLITFLLFFSSLFLHSSQQTLISPISKDDSTKLYTLLIYLKTPLQPSKLHLDLGSFLPYYDCARHYKSSSYKPLPGNSTLCKDLNTGISVSCDDRPVGPDCFRDDTCGFVPQNPVTRKTAVGAILTDKFALPTTKKPGLPGPVTELLLTCTFPDPNSRIYKGLAKGSNGLAALGRFNYSLPAQLSRAFSSPLIFAVCLPGSSTAPGLALFNTPGPYYFSPTINLSKSLIYTPLIPGPGPTVFEQYKSPDYYLGLTSIKVNSFVVPLNKTLLDIDENGKGGVKISTYTPYTLLQTSIFKALVNAFVKESAKLNLTVTAAVKPFSVCYAADKITSTRVGPGVPTVDLVLQSDKVIWRIYGSNSMVRVDDKWCLGFVDGGLNPRTSIVIGGHQLEDNLLQFDLVRERLGFSSSLLVYSTTCANFDSTKN